MYRFPFTIWSGVLKRCNKQTWIRDVWWFKLGCVVSPEGGVGTIVSGYNSVEEVVPTGNKPGGGKNNNCGGKCSEFFFGSSFRLWADVGQSLRSLLVGSETAAESFSSLLCQTRFTKLFLFIQMSIKSSQKQTETNSRINCSVEAFFMWTPFLRHIF